jgi:hypothetical protein
MNFSIGLPKWVWAVVVPVAVAIMALVLLTGCATMTKTVEVPVPVPCIVPDVPRPAFAIDTIEPDSDVFVVARAMWATIEQWEAYEIQLQAAIDACK